MPFSASDIERFAYCPRNWWLFLGGHDGTGAPIVAGVARHAAAGGDIARIRRLQKRRRDSLEVALWIALCAASAATIAVEVTALYGSGTLVNGLILVVALVWLLAASLFLHRSLRAHEEEIRFQRLAGTVQGEIRYSDLDRSGDLLVSKTYEISGRPDYVVQRDEGLVPVEVKTGKTPKRPHESHVLQLAAYCELVAETTGRRPALGVVQYDDARFEIPYDEALRDRLLETVLRMRLAEATGEAHRDHENAKKCLGCSRRGACDERLV
ncbi:MAG: CRISPR-associated protein Cas4 [Methanobacteriota archaeon]